MRGIDILVECGIKSNFTKLTPDNLRSMFKLYDKYFFHNEIMSELYETSSKITFKTTSTGITKVAGWCRIQRKEMVNIFLDQS